MTAPTEVMRPAEDDEGERWLIGQTRDQWDYDVEDAVIASCLVHEDALAAVAATGLKPDDFMGLKGQLSYAAILRVRDEMGGYVVNQVTVAHDLATRKHLNVTELEAVGGGSWFSRIIGDLPTWVGCEWYGRIVVRLAEKRRLTAIGEALAGGRATPEQAAAMLGVRGDQPTTTGMQSRAYPRIGAQ